MTRTLSVLGSGTCFPESGKPRRAHPGFFIRYGNTPDAHLLLECSQAIAERLEARGIDADSIANVAISHPHPDHCAWPQFIQSMFCARTLRAAKKKTNQELTVIAPQILIEHFDVFNRVFFQDTFVHNPNGGLPFPILKPIIAPQQNLTLPEGAMLSSYPVYHGFGKVDAVAYRLTLPDGIVIAYSGDSGLCPGLEDAARDADYFICEASARVSDETNATGYGHLNPSQAGALAAKLNVRTLILTHYSGFDSYEDMFKAVRAGGFKERSFIAHDELVFEF